MTPDIICKPSVFDDGYWKVTACSEDGWNWWIAKFVPEGMAGYSDRFEYEVTEILDIIRQAPSHFVLEVNGLGMSDPAPQLQEGGQ